MHSLVLINVGISDAATVVLHICLKYGPNMQICLSPTLPHLDPIPAAAAAVHPLHPGRSKNRDIGIA